MSLIINTWLDCYTADGANMLNCGLSHILQATRGETVFGLLIGGALMLGFYKASNGSLAAASVLTGLAGPLLIPVLPGQLAAVATTIMFLGLVGGMLSVLNKYVMSTGV